MAKPAIGLSDAEIDAIAQEVPDVVRVKQCNVCLWAGRECRKGCGLILNTERNECITYTYAYFV
jgi:hypothetical protein